MRSSNLPWQISTFCFAFKWKHNAKKNYDTNTKKNPAAYFNTRSRRWYKSNLYFIQNNNGMKNETRGRVLWIGWR